MTDPCRFQNALSEGNPVFSSCSHPGSLPGVPRSTRKSRDHLPTTRISGHCIWAPADCADVKNGLFWAIVATKLPAMVVNPSSRASGQSQLQATDAPRGVRQNDSKVQRRLVTGLTRPAGRQGVERSARRVLTDVLPLPPIWRTQRLGLSEPKNK